MPIYEFRCRECGVRFEAIRPMGDTGRELECPSCGAARPEKQLSVFSASTGGGSGPDGPGLPPCGSGFG